MNESDKSKNELEIKLGALPNNCMIKEPCPLCGTWDRPDAPYWIFLNGDLRESVCYGCAEKYAPNLLKVVCDANAKHHQDYELEEKKRERTKKKLLEHYSGKPASNFIQYDAFVDPSRHDDIVKPNPGTGVCVMSGLTTELMGTCNEVRILISKEATKSQALRGIKDIFKWIKREEYGAQQKLYQARSDALKKEKKGGF